MEPSVGRIVLVRNEYSNGINEHPAIITRVWNATCVNVHLFLDGSPSIIKTSVMYNEDMSAIGLLWRWPPRV